MLALIPDPIMMKNHFPFGDSPTLFRPAAGLGAAELKAEAIGGAKLHPLSALPSLQDILSTMDYLCHDRL